ncbi:MAG: leucine-rich repeat domain-containing protein [Clostridia bacterium]|nr:leucine-rich repeat domain-containing protein [Clostridia bacterium]
MKKLLFLCALLLCLLWAACALAENVTFRNYYGTVTVDKNAEYVDLGSVKVPNSDEDFRALYTFLDQLPKVKKVVMFSTDIRRARIDEMASRYPDIEFGWSMIIPCHNELHPERNYHRIRTDATAFSTLHNNTCSEHSARDFEILKYCKNLQALDIGHNRVTDLSFLYDLPHLKVLIVACNIELKDITPIGSLKELQYLEIFKNDIHDISCLANCTELVDLNICFNRISDWSPLEGLTHLRRLWLFNSNNYSDNIPVPQDVVAALRGALPDCKVDAVSYSTDGGWRNHPRYDTINTMFWGTDYIPFTTLD